MMVNAIIRDIFRIVNTGIYQYLCLFDSFEGCWLAVVIRENNQDFSVRREQYISINSLFLLLEKLLHHLHLLTIFPEVL